MSAATTTNTTIKRVDLIKTGSFKADGNHLVTSSVPVPVPSENEVLIDIKASDVNPIDWKMAEYNILLPSIVDQDHPVALGCDVAGVVVGPTSSPLYGKRVVTYLGASKANYPDNRGAFAEKVVTDSRFVFEIPEEMSFVEAVTVPVGGLTAKLLVEAIEPVSKPGEYVLVWGASSSVGFFAVQLAKRYGYHVIAVASGKHKDLCMDLGATEFIDYRTQDVKQAAGLIMKSAEGPAPKIMNGAIDCIGTNDVLSTCADLLSEFSSAETGTTKSIIGTVSPFGPGNLPDGVTLAAVNLGTAVDDKPEFIERALPMLLDLTMQPTQIISGPVDAITVENGFQLSKDGVSGEKIVFEWTN